MYNSSCVFISLMVLLSSQGLSTNAKAVECICGLSFNAHNIRQPICFNIADIFLELNNRHILDSEYQPVLDGKIPGFLNIAHKNVGYIYLRSTYVLDEFSLKNAKYRNNQCYNKNAQNYINKYNEMNLKVHRVACPALASIKNSLDGFVITCLNHSIPLNKNNCLNWTTSPDPMAAYRINIANVLNEWNDYISDCLNSTATA